MNPPPESPEIISYRIPRIEIYQVTDDELRRIEDGFGQVSQDLTFAAASLSFSTAFAIAIVTVTLSDRLFAIFLSFVVIFGLVALYTSVRWWRARKVAPAVIATIRSRKVEPEVAPANGSDG